MLSCRLLKAARKRAAGVKNRTPPPSVQIPLFRYFTVVGGVLLAALFIANAYLPANRIDAGNKPISKPPKVLIESSRKWPERIVFDTNLPTTLAVIAEEPAVVSPVPPSSINSMAQLTSSRPATTAARPHIVKPKPVKMARVSRTRFAYFQKARRYPDFFENWW
jgi:hypothetical protein